MRVYGSSVTDFQDRLLRNELLDLVQREYLNVVGRSAPQSEVNSWRGSYPRLEMILRLAHLPEDVWIGIEEKVPYSSERMDATLFGYDGNGVPNMVIVELKAWTDAKALSDGNVETFLGGGLQAIAHPSEQVRGYHDHLLDFSKAFQGKQALKLSSCAYCHNYAGTAPDGGLFHPQFGEIRAQSPTFGERDASALAEFLRSKLVEGKGEKVVRMFDAAGVGPSKQLIEHASEMIQQQNVFRLLGDQISANNAILRAIRQATQRKRKQVILVDGGPGTGKSVIALNALGEALRNEREVYLVAGSAAFTWSMRKLLGKRLTGLIRFTDFSWDAPPDGIDVLIIDEAHRIRAKSTPRVRGELRPTISQTEELMRAAKVVVLFADETQIISPKEVGEPQVIEETAKSLGAHFDQYPLVSQFRCNGSDAYLSWLDDVFEVRGPSEGALLATPKGFDFKLVATPHKLLAEVCQKNREVVNSARLIAGWCWKWSDPKADGTLVDDIVIGDFKFPWEAKNNSHPAQGIPEAKWWAIDPAGVNQAGTVYSVQGFEARHVGVILGPDLVVRDGKWTAIPKNNFHNDLRRLDPEEALPYLKRIYRTLLSRGMQSCSVYCMDPETRWYLESRIMPR